MEQLVERYTQIPPGQRYLLAVLIVGGLIAGHYYMLYTSQDDKLGSLRDKYGRQQNVRAEKQNVAQNKAMYEARINKLQQQLDEARRQLPDSADVPQLLAQLGDKERQSGLTLTDFQPAKELSKGVFAEVGFDVKATGSYHEIAIFIDALSNLDRIIDVTDLEMKSPDTKASKIVVKTNFKVRTYRFVGDDGKGKK